MIKTVTREHQSPLGPWPDVATASLFLRGLLTGPQKQKDEVDHKLDAFIREAAGPLADWLIEQGLGTLAYRRYGRRFPELKRRLIGDEASAIGEASFYKGILEEIASQFSNQQLPLMLLKGAALVQYAYSKPGTRTMSDVDIWVPADRMADAVSCMESLGFHAIIKDTRPIALQWLGGGEIQFQHPEKKYTMVELHWGPADGWWFQRAASLDTEGMWRRRTGLSADNQFRLQAEDQVILVAVHLAVNHRFGRTALRALFDILFLAHAQPLDWSTIAARACEWRVATACWAVFDLAQQLLCVPGLDMMVTELRPSLLRRRLIHRIVSPESILAGLDLRGSRKRYLLQLLLVDRPRDMLRLLFRAIWPEREWLVARYQGENSRWQHLRNALWHGRV